MAALICVAVAPGWSVEQTVVRVGMPPTTPARDQSIARVGSMMPAHGGPAGAPPPLPLPVVPLPPPAPETLPGPLLAAAPTPDEMSGDLPEYAMSVTAT